MVTAADTAGIYLLALAKPLIGCMSGEKNPLVWVIAGEPSGDLIGARLMVALRERAGGNPDCGYWRGGYEKGRPQSLFPVQILQLWDS